MLAVPLIDTATIDFRNVLFGLEAIRLAIPQRFEMEQLSGILSIDLALHRVVGYKDVGLNEFWSRGQALVPPVMPATLVCEAAAQLCSFYCRHANLVAGRFLGFGGIDDAHFEGSVKGGDRLILAGQAERLHRRQMVFQTQAFVGSNLVFQGRILGVPLSRTEPTT